MLFLLADSLIILTIFAMVFSLFLKLCLRTCEKCKPIPSIPLIANTMRSWDSTFFFDKPWLWACLWWLCVCLRVIKIECSKGNWKLVIIYKVTFVKITIHSRAVRMDSQTNGGNISIDIDTAESENRNCFCEAAYSNRSIRLPRKSITVTRILHLPFLILHYYYDWPLDWHVSSYVWTFVVSLNLRVKFNINLLIGNR